MANKSLTKLGVPVLVYLTSEPLSLPCSMRIFRNDGNQFSIALHVSTTLSGTEEEQLFVAQYDADNLLSETTTLNSKTTTIHLQPDRLKQITRRAQPITTTLSLTFRDSCPIWCPRNSPLAPQAHPESVAAFHELVNLAKAKTVDILFDYNWLHRDVQDALERLVKAKQKLTAIPLERHYNKLWQRKDWTAFAPAVTAGEVSHKRPRPVSGSPSPLPPSKRITTDEEYAPPSPTEVATSPPSYPTDEEHSWQFKAISAVVIRHLPAIIKQVLPSHLPSLLPPLFALPTSPSVSYDSQASQPMELTPLGAVLVPHILTHIKPQLQTLHTQSLARTEEQRAEAELEFEERIEDLELELKQIVQQGMQDLQHEADYALDKLRTDGDEVIEDVVCETEFTARAKGEEVIATVKKQLGLLEKRSVEELVEWEVARQMQASQGHTCRCAIWMRRDGRRRGKGGYKGLGKRWRTSFLPL